MIGTEEHTVVVPLSLSMRQKVAMASVGYFALLLHGALKFSARNTGPTPVLGSVLLLVSCLLGGVLFGLLRGLSVRGISLSSVFLLCVSAGSSAAVPFVASSSDTGVVILTLSLSLGSLLVILWRLPGPGLSHGLKKEGVSLLAGGLVSSACVLGLGWLLLTLLDYASDPITLASFTVPSPTGFLVAGTLLGGAYSFVRPKLPLPHLAAGMLYGFLIVLGVSLSSYLVYGFPLSLLTYSYTPGLALKSLTWIGFGLMLGIFSRLRKPPTAQAFSTRDSAMIYSMVTLVILLGAAAWMYPSFAGPSGKGLALEASHVPPDLSDSWTRYVGFMTNIAQRLVLDIYGEKADTPFPRLLQEFHGPLQENNTAGHRSIQLSVSSSTPAVARETVKEGDTRSSLITLPEDLGDISNGFEEGPDWRSIHFSVGGFVATYSVQNLDWGETIAVGRNLEARLASRVTPNNMRIMRSIMKHSWIPPWENPSNMWSFEVSANFTNLGCPGWISVVGRLTHEESSWEKERAHHLERGQSVIVTILLEDILAETDRNVTSDDYRYSIDIRTR